MNGQPDGRQEVLQVSQRPQIDRACEHFQAAWEAGQHPRIEDYLAVASDSCRAELLQRLVARELICRSRSGETPTAEEYERRFPADASTVRQAFSRSPRSPADRSEHATHSNQNVAAAETETQQYEGPQTQETCTPEQPEHIGRYQVTGILGRGGFGTVYRACDAELQRDVAIKVWRRDRFAGDEQVEQLLQEARLVARLDKHPAIVGVHDAGRQGDGSAFVVFEYIEGHSLAQELKSHQLAPDRVWEIMLQVTSAIQHAHATGLVHRDLKPANVLLDADGNAHVADFGLAIDDQSQRFHAGEVSGTPAYMAPEQVRGEAHRLDGRADLWALGVMLYEMLTRRRPFQGQTHPELFDEILHREPKPPRQLDPEIPADLERICLKCLTKSVTERYLTAADLAKDLRHAQEAPQRRKRRLVTIASAVAAGLVILGAVWAFLVVARSQPVISVQPNAGLKIRHRATLRGHTDAVWSVAFSPDDRTLASAGVDMSVKLWHVPDAHEIQQLTGHRGEVRCVAFAPDGKTLASASNDRSIMVWVRETGKLQRQITGHTGDVRSIVFLPSGNRLVSGSVDKTIRFWDPQTGSEQKNTEPHRAAIQSVTCTRDGETLASASDDKTIELLSAESGELLRTLTGHTDGVAHAAFSPDGRRLASASWDKTIRIWDVATGKLLRTIDQQEDAVRSVAFSPDGKRLASGGNDNTIRLWDAETGQELATLRGHAGSVTSVAFSSDGHILASASSDRTVMMWELEEAPVESVDPPKKIASGRVALNTTPTEVGPGMETPKVGTMSTPPPVEDGEVVAETNAASGKPTTPADLPAADGLPSKPLGTWPLTPADAVFPGIISRPAAIPGIHHWQVETAVRRGGEVDACVWSPDGRTIAHTVHATSIRICDAQTLETKRILLGHLDEVKALAWSPDGQWLASAAGDETLRLWRPDGSPGPVCRLRAGFQTPGVMSWHPDGELLAVPVGPNPNIEFWHTDGTPGPVLRNDGTGYFRLVGWSGNGRWLAAWDSGAHAVLIWKFDGSPAGIIDEVLGFAWHPEETRLATACMDGKLRIWDTSDKELLVFDGHPDGIRAVAWSPDGERLASVGVDKKVRLWKADGTPGEVLDGGADVGAVTWSPDGKFVAATAYDGPENIRIWAVDGEPRLVAKASFRTTWGPKWSPDSKRLTFGSWLGHLAIVNTEGTTAPNVGRCSSLCAIVAWQPEQSGLTACGLDDDKWVRTWGPDGRLQRRFQIDDGQLSTMAWAPDGKRVATAGFNGNVVFVRDVTGAARFKPVELKGHSAGVVSLAWSSDGLRVASAGVDKTLRLWDPGGTSVKVLDGHTSPLSAVAYSADGQWLASGSEDGEVRIWKPDGMPVSSFNVSHKVDRGGLAFSPDGRHLAISLYDYADVWTREGQRVVSWHAELWDGCQPLLAWSPDGNRLISAASGAPLVDITGKSLPPLSATELFVRSVAWNRDGRHVALGCAGSLVRSWNLETGYADWVAIPFVDGTSVTFSAAGEVIDGDPAVLEKQIVYVVQRTPDGPQELLSYDEFQKLVPKSWSEAATNKSTPPAALASPVARQSTGPAPPPAVAPFDEAPAKQHQEAWAAYLGVPIEYTNSIGMKFRLIPPGEFDMGSSEAQIAEYLKEAEEWRITNSYVEAVLRERPQHRVRLSKPLYLGMYEVTLRHFRLFVEATGYRTDAEKDGKGGTSRVNDESLQDPRFIWSGDLGLPQTEDHPVVNVSWNDADAFCDWLCETEGKAYSLPSEAQWEFACRAGCLGRYGFGDDESLLDQYCWFSGNSRQQSHPVGEKRPNGFGIHDMHGNVREWCADWYGDEYSSQAVLIDPAGSSQGSFRVNRGGDWYNFTKNCRAAYRFRTSPTDRIYNLGFRVALDLQPATKGSSLSLTTPAKAAQGATTLRDATPSSVEAPHLLTSSPAETKPLSEPPPKKQVMQVQPAQQSDHDRERPVAESTEFLSLFDGKTLAGWRGLANEQLPATCRVVDDTIEMKGAHAYIVSREKFQDFELNLEWRVSPGGKGNGGVYYRFAEKRNAVGGLEGPEMQAVDNDDANFPASTAGSLFRIFAAPASAAQPVGEWNNARLIVEGDHVEHWLGSTKVIDYGFTGAGLQSRLDGQIHVPDNDTFGKTRSSPIALQGYSGTIWYRNICVRRLTPSFAKTQ